MHLLWQGLRYARKQEDVNNKAGLPVCSAGFFLHIVAFDGLSLFGIRLAAGVATGMYASALIAKSYETTTGNNSKLTLVGIISFGSLDWFAGRLA